MKVTILGAGPGGYVAAIRAAQLGAEVIVVEESEVGGTCLNRGCIPTKALVASAEVLDKAKKAKDFGLELSGEVSANIQKIIERKNKIVGIQVKGIRGLFKSWGVRILDGRGVITGPGKISVTLKDGGAEEIETDKIIIATGSRPAQIPIFPFDGEKILSSTDALNLEEIPKRLLVIGAGVIGCEFAFIYKEFGSEVTMVEMMPKAVSTEDEEISAVLERELKKKKIKLLTNIKMEKIEVKEDSVQAFLSDGKTIEADKVLVSIGRAMNSENLGLESIGVKTGQRGEIIANSRMETNVDGVYAAGDVTGGIMLAHLASKEGVVAAENAVGGDSAVNYDVVPAAIFTSPEIGSVGLREKQAVEKGLKVRIGRFQFRALGKAHAMGEIAGIVKLIADEESDKLLGAHIIGPHASDLVHEAALAIEKGLTARDIAHMIHAHPTLAEGIMEAAEDVHDSAIHMPKK
ncbi:dihydrolipoyl dehydrogenase [bacterium BMS3Abin10]|nr:dihydrolipoyl dehydrogenase [bacterium BMS3Abin10]GBE38751.1 dihydrolipoyl dehydrogenase [bacterium BMS3Bbin08]HDH50838.1 dihydrolipoyl dehydrogenase [Nitrospirota bacterium]HDK17063.1 dihydrolipoyl dehydrogenase [Nitrospirota bacterium]HDK41302.1 dihydrolipoyl dehydrogenase [Nitrospirota bacterium]